MKAAHGLEGPTWQEEEEEQEQEEDQGGRRGPGRLVSGSVGLWQRSDVAGSKRGLERLQKKKKKKTTTLDFVFMCMFSDVLSGLFLPRVITTCHVFIVQ